MSFDSEVFRERQRLRKERQQLRQAQKKKKRMRLLVAGLAVVILAAVILVICLLPSGGESAKPQTSPQTQYTQPEGTDPAEQTAPTEPQDTVIRIAAAGDLNITDQVVAAGGSAMDYSKAFMDVAHLLADADVSILNLEGNLVGEPYGGTYFSAPQSMMQALGDAGVDLVQLANSYSIRNGMSGLAATIDGVRAAGMEPVGAFATQEDYEKSGGYTVVETQGIRIAFVAFTKGMDGMTLPAGNSDCVNILYSDYDLTYQKVNYDKINEVMDAVDAASPDLVVAMLHWGSEFNDTISSSQESILSHLQSRGVDAIIGTHSHYVQQMRYDEATGRFLAFSLGDFFGDAARAGSEYSVILQLEVTKEAKTGKCRITGYDYTPIFTVTEEGSAMRVVRIHEAVAAYDSSYMDRVSRATYDAMKYALERIEARVKGE